jgi:hypothetical protein
MPARCVSDATWSQVDDENRYHAPEIISIAGPWSEGWIRWMKSFIAISLATELGEFNSAEMRFRPAVLLSIDV